MRDWLTDCENYVYKPQDVFEMLPILYNHNYTGNIFELSGPPLKSLSDKPLQIVIICMTKKLQSD